MICQNRHWGKMDFVHCQLSQALTRFKTIQKRREINILHKIRFWSFSNIRLFCFCVFHFRSTGFFWIFFFTTWDNFFLCECSIRSERVTSEKIFKRFPRPLGFQPGCICEMLFHLNGTVLFYFSLFKVSIFIMSFW